MLSCSSAQSAKSGSAKNQNANLKPEEEGKEEEEEDMEEEDEDVDFNPFLKETPSQEASSSLSSEVDALDDNVVNSEQSVGTKSKSKLTTKKEQVCAAVDSEHEGILLQSSALIPQSETNQGKHDNLTCAIDDNGPTIGELNNTAKSLTPIIDIDSEDAICMRTRARYSLASFTLDELETFLQETDDDDDLQNVNDEEEYRKFLTAVLQGGDANGLSSHENEILDDEDEDNDADFEIELEELLESDADENASVNAGKEQDGAGRRPETRQNKRQKVSTQCEKKTLGRVKRPLRPILPNCFNAPLASGKGLMPEATSSFNSCTPGSGLVNGFTAQQIGQLHCLIHEHVQLLIQVFSLSVLEPSQKQIASQVQGLLSEMLHKRDEALALKRTPYPSICFTPSSACTSLSNGITKHVQRLCNVESAYTQEGQGVCFPQSNQRYSEGSLWVPCVKGPVQSILDVSPLSLVGGYVEDINSAAQEFRKRYIESSCDSHVAKEPLFPFSSPSAEANGAVSSGTTNGAVNTILPSPGQQQPKKTLAAMLVESTKKQSIALVPKEVAKLAQRFVPLFNPSLFPHKPPPAAVVNRVLFTDSEDELLALGILEYNTDWKAIQQRFLPCKSKHQIFVRQKNRCSSKSPENPIKAVRRMKTSPLTAEEIARIQEGLKYYKFDWMLVWQFIVPHRDPSLLPRQWRIALGTQKSYKVDASKKEKRRLYESKRRKLKAAAVESWQTVSDKEDCDAEIAGSENCMDYSEAPYVHQAFLADWRPDASLTYSERLPSTSVEGTQDHNSNRPAFPSASNLQQFIHTPSNLRNGMHGASSTIKPKIPGLGVTSSSTYYCRPYRSRKANHTHLVKLAPDLPPVNLPPSVRVVSQTAFKGFQCGTPKIYPPEGGGVTACRKDSSVSQIPHGDKIDNIHQAKIARPALKDNVTSSRPERSGTVEGRSIMAEKGTCSDFQMHPLLFQVAEDANVPYYPLNSCSGTSGSFSFFSGSQPQLNLSLFHSSHQQSQVDYPNKATKSKDSTLRSGSIDFHPLLQKSNDTQSPTNFDAGRPESLVNSDEPAMVNRSSGPNEKSSELDLEMHLSSVTGRGKSVKSRKQNVHDPLGSKVTVAVGGKTVTPQHSQQGDKNPSAGSCELASSALPLVVPNDNITRYDVDDIGDHSHLGIVMEQEELSDSEEDIEEHVEFECEEMADSEGEDGSGCEQAPELQNKEFPTSEENVAKHPACIKDPRDLRAGSDAQLGDSLLNDASTLNMAFARGGYDSKNNSSWLSLDSSSSDNPMLSKMNMNMETGAISESLASKNLAIGKAITEEKSPIDMIQQPAVGPLVFDTPRKPRKPSGKSNTNFDTGFPDEIPSLDSNNKDG